METKPEVKKSIYTRLAKIQQELKAPKSNRNSFGNYNYRSCEDILEAVKPLLDGLVILIEDRIEQFGDRFYVRATVKLTDGKNEVTNSAYARESLDKKGMDDSQITGATSSYARKYALNGLLAIDDTKDADTMDNTERKVVPSEEITPDNDVMMAYGVAKQKAGELGKCSKCGDDNKLSSSGKIYCGATCWLNK